MLSLLEGKQLKAGEQRNEGGRIAIVVRMPRSSPRRRQRCQGGGAPSAVIDVARRHRALIERAGFSTRPASRRPASPRCRDGHDSTNQAAVVKRRVAVFLLETRDPPRACAVSRATARPAGCRRSLRPQPVLCQKQRVPATAPRSKCRAGAALLSSGGSDHIGLDTRRGPRPWPTLSRASIAVSMPSPSPFLHFAAGL
jgi:hypothetical protein